MSIARGFGLNGKSLYTNITKPCQVDLQFTVTPTNGLGVTSLKSNGYVRNVFMHTSTTPTSNDGALNPNPASGMVLVQLTNNFNKFLSMAASLQAPNSTTQLTSTTANTAYVIGSAGTATGYTFTVTSANATQGATYTNNTQTFTVLGTISSGTTLVTSGTGDPQTSGTLTKTSGSGDATITFSAHTAGAATTTAQWQAVGLPAGLTPTAGQSFIATASQAIGGSAWVVTPSTTGISSVEVVGDPNQSIANSSIAANGGAYVMLQMLGNAITLNSYTPAGTNSAPALTMNSYTPAGTNANDGPPETFTGTPATLTGTVAAPVFSGTPATITGTASAAPAAPTAGTVVSLRLSFDGSSVTVDGL